MGHPRRWVPDPIERTRGRQSAKGTHHWEGFRSSPIQKFAGVDCRSEKLRRKLRVGATPCVPSLNSVRDQASVVGGESGSVCGEATRERPRLCLVFLGCEAASSIRSGFDPERVAAPEVG
jgi:hypothetical protein